ncbi:MAG: hypothetical protein ACYC7H_08550, partial [Chloroflexota bacterium]
MQQPRSATSKAEQIKPEGALGRVLRVYKAYSHNVVGNQLVMIGFSIAVFLLLVAAAADIIAPASPFATVPVNAL